MFQPHFSTYVFERNPLHPKIILFTLPYYFTAFFIFLTYILHQFSLINSNAFNLRICIVIPMQRMSISFDAIASNHRFISQLKKSELVVYIQSLKAMSNLKMLSNKHSTNEESDSLYNGSSESSSQKESIKKQKKIEKTSKVQSSKLQNPEKKSKNQKNKYTMWKKYEQVLFLKWLRNYSDNFVSEKEKRRTKAFVKIAQKMKGRTALQCKSHYQRIQKITKNGTVQEIIDWLQNQLSKTEPAQQKQRISRLLAQFDINKSGEIETETLIVKNQGIFICFALPLGNISTW